MDVSEVGKKRGEESGEVDYPGDSVELGAGGEDLEGLNVWGEVRGCGEESEGSGGWGGFFVEGYGREEIWACGDVKFVRGEATAVKSFPVV